ncbi:MAG: hypothetical protein ACRD0U_07845 [Acidimicrobiales bacterium]
MVRLVIVRDPAEAVSIYAGRWAIEIAYRDVKQIVGGQEPQSWKNDGPERAVGLPFWLYRAVCVWYLGVSGKRPHFTVQPWYPAKTTPSFADTLAELRRMLWHERISPASHGGSLSAETVNVLVEALAVAA